jgi:hypothetical protein
MSQIDINRKACDIGTWKKHLFLDISSTNIGTCPIALPVRRNPQHRSLLTVVSATSTPLRLPNVLERISRPSCGPLYETNTSHRKYETLFMNIIYTESFCPQKKKDNRKLLFCSTLFKHGRHFDYWNQPLNMRMRVCYLHCHETGLCCYLVIHIENLLRPLQMFYIHWWPDWLPLILFGIISWCIHFHTTFICKTKELSLRTSRELMLFFPLPQEKVFYFSHDFSFHLHFFYTSSPIFLSINLMMPSLSYNAFSDGRVSDAWELCIKMMLFLPPTIKHLSVFPWLCLSSTLLLYSLNNSRNWFPSSKG